MKSLIDLYKSAASSIGLVTDSQGFINTLLPGSDTPKPWLVGNPPKRAVMPIEEQLKQHDWSGRVGFHPLLQNLGAGDSPVMEKFRERMNAYSDFVLGMLLHDIGKLALKEEMHKDLTSAQVKYLVPFQDADARFIKLLYDLITAKRINKKGHEFIHFNVIKGRVWQGQKRSRVASMHFPLYDKLPTDGKGTVLLGHTLRQKDVKMLRAMYKMLFSYIDERGQCEVGSDSKIGPSFESLMSVYAKFADEVNNAVGVLEPVIDSSTELLIVNDWKDDIANAEQYLSQVRNIPMLEGNVGSERLVQAMAPQHISENAAPIINTQAVNNSPAPVINTATISHIQSTSPTQTMQQPSEAPKRFKLGSSAPTVNSMNPHHQLPQDMSNEPKVIGYSRQVHQNYEPTPPVGTLLAAQQSHQQPQHFSTNVLQAQQPVQQTVQAVKIPDTVRMVNGVMYIPLEANGVNAVPQGAITIDSKIYVPFGQPGQVGQQTVINNQFQQGNRFGGQQPQQMVTDPSQIPGLTAEEINYYRNNPLIFQNVLNQLQQNTAIQANAVHAQRQQQVPNYLQRAVQTAADQQRANVGFFPHGMR